MTDQFPSWRKRQINAACCFRAYDESRRENSRLFVAHLASREDKATLITDTANLMARAARIYGFDEKLSRHGKRAIDAKGKMNHRVGDLMPRFYFAKHKSDLIRVW